MAKVILLIGKLCSGKTTAADRIVREENAVLISADEIMQTIFPEPLGEKYDVYSHRAMKYLYATARRLAASGVTTVLDWGYWTRASREEAKTELAGLDLDWRYLEISDEEWHKRIAGRNAAIENGTAGAHAYYVDDGLMQKFTGRFQPPEEDENLQLTMLSSHQTHRRS